MPEELNAIFGDAIARHIFPGATVWLANGEKVLAHAAFGTTAYQREYSAPVTTETLYDIASITKLFTATAFLMAARENNISIETPLAHFLPEFGSHDKREIRLKNLLQHNSGIEIAIQSLLEISPQEWIEKIAAAPLRAAPQKRVLYSCTNFFLLARMVEMMTKTPLDDFIAQEILHPLGMKRTTWTPLEKFSKDEIAPTEIENEIVCHGVVHDPAARAWREYSLHASCGNSGLFSTASDLAKFALLWRDGGIFENQELLNCNDCDLAFQETVVEENPKAQRGLGWQLDAGFYMSEKAPRGSAGHAGFTGPTLWLHPNTKHVCIILNNRVFPSRDNESRFPTHRKIARWLMKNSLL